MGSQSQDTGDSANTAGPMPARRGRFALIKRTAVKAWDHSIFSEAAEAAFWQTLSLPPLLLGLLGTLGFVGDWFGPRTVELVQEKILGFSGTVFTPDVVNGVIGPTVANILTSGRGEIASIGFLISLWAGSSATASFVDAITVAHDQYGVRNLVWQRFLALLLYMVTLVLLITGLPVLALGPELLPKVFPVTWRDDVTYWVDMFYYPATGVLLVIALATLYKVALPRKLPWHRGLPGAVLAMAFFLAASWGLRFYIRWLTGTGFTYGALATPIAFLLFAFFIGFAIVLGAHFNSAIQELWPARMTGRERRRWRRLEMERAAGRLRSESEERQWHEREWRAEEEREHGEPEDEPERDPDGPSENLDPILHRKLPEASSPADTNDTIPLRRSRRPLNPSRDQPR